MRQQPHKWETTVRRLERGKKKGTAREFTGTIIAAGGRHEASVQGRVNKKKRTGFATSAFPVLPGSPLSPTSLPLKVRRERKGERRKKGRRDPQREKKQLSELIQKPLTLKSFSTQKKSVFWGGGREEGGQRGRRGGGRNRADH